MNRSLLKAVAFLLLLLSGPALAQLPAARLNAFFPPGGQPGTSVAVTLDGTDLDGVSELRFSHPGITAKKNEAGEGFTVTIAGDVPAAGYDVRAVGKYGVSNPRVLVVDPRGVAIDAKAGQTPADAGKLQPDQLVFARTTASAVDFWALEAKQGQRVILECDARAIDSKLVPDMTLLDASGRELAHSRRSGLLDFTAVAEGSYVLRLNDLLYRGGPEFAYRLCLSTGPHLDAIFPGVARRGAKGAFTLLGRNLPGGKRSAFLAADGLPLDELSVEVDVPAQVPADRTLDAAGLVGPRGALLYGLAYRLNAGPLVSNPVPILLADDDVTPEAESAQPSAARNDRPTDAQHLSLPVDIAGRFHAQNDHDAYAFDAKKGDQYVIEVVADRLARPMCVSFVLQKIGADGTVSDVLASADDEFNPGTASFRTATRDPLMKWEVKEDAAYRLTLRDEFGTALADPTRGYRLSVRRPRPGFRVIAMPLSSAGTESSVWSPTLRRGGSSAIRASVVRQDGFDGDVTLHVEGLPAGVACPTVTIRGSDTAGVLVMTAGPDATAWAGEIRVIATARVFDADVTREAVYGSVVWGTLGTPNNADATRAVDPVISRVARGLSLGVCVDQPEPVTVAATEARVYEVEAGKKLSVPLTVRKSVELRTVNGGGMKLKPIGVEAIRNAKDVDGAKPDPVFELDLSQNKLAPGTYSICLAAAVLFKPPVIGEASKGDGDKGKTNKGQKGDMAATVYSAPITFTVLPPSAVKDKKQN